MSNINVTINFVHEYFEGDHSGHDFDHMMRVYSLAKEISKKEHDSHFEFTTLLALLHDTLDHKIVNIEEKRPEIWAFIDTLSLADSEKEMLFESIPKVSYSANVPLKELNDSIKIVQDADRIDALGAIGIARAFAYGGYRGQKIAISKDFDPDDYGENQTSVSHFYEKLFKLPETLHTDSAMRIAQKRVHFMQAFLKQMAEEWQGLK